MKAGAEQVNSPQLQIPPLAGLPPCNLFATTFIIHNQHHFPHTFTHLHLFISIMDPPTKTYTGNCHCAAFRFSLTLPTQFTLKDLHSCNCSICSRKGYLLPETAAQDFQWLKGSVGELSKYSFGGRENEHAFCGTCGGAVLIRDGEGIYVNLRCLEGVDTWGLESVARQYASP